MGKILGRNMTVTVGSVPVAYAKECSIDRDINLVESTTRADGGMKAYEYGNSDEKISFTIEVESGDSILSALYGMKQNKTKATVSVVTVFGTETGTVLLAGLNEEQPEEGAIKLSVELTVDGGLST